jgi:hypothetical protein
MPNLASGGVGAGVIRRLVWFAAALPLSLGYGLAFSYTMPVVVYVAIISCLILLTVPLWWRPLLGASASRLVLYYVCVAVVLFLAVMMRITVESLIKSN